MSWIDIENKFLEKFAKKIHNLKNKTELIDSTCLNFMPFQKTNRIFFQRLNLYN